MADSAAAPRSSPSSQGSFPYHRESGTPVSIRTAFRPRLTPKPTTSNRFQDMADAGFNAIQVWLPKMPRQLYVRAA